MTHRVVLAGCTPVPLASYLKALGVLRLVAEQADPDARGYWENEQFVLESRLDEEGLNGFFLEQYEPTPIIAPWNGGSGFYPKDNKSGIEPIEQGDVPRLRALRDAIGVARTNLDQLGLQEKPEGEAKRELLNSLRAKLDDRALAWLDASVLLTEENPKYPPLLGTGGNDGRLDFTNNFMQRLVALF
jgi:CRISPR-associated protein Csx17